MYGRSLQIDAGIPGAEDNWVPSFGVSDVHAQNVTIRPIVNAWYYVGVKKCMLSVRDSVYIVVDSIDKPRIAKLDNTLSTNKAFFRERKGNGCNQDQV